MGQNNHTTEHGDRQGQQGGQQAPKKNMEQSRPGLPDENIAGGNGLDKKANQGSSKGDSDPKTKH